jgi:hypothetical protein
MTRGERRAAQRLILLDQNHSGVSSSDVTFRFAACPKSRLAVWLFFLSVILFRNASAELPLARLQSIFPAGAQIGQTVNVTVEGTDLDDASTLHFSTPGISSKHDHGTNSAGSFTVIVSSNVPPGLYEARVVGRFGISNPRFFAVGTLNELNGGALNRSIETALPVPMNSTVNALAAAAAADFYKFEVRKDERFLIICLGEPYDSKMRPV